MPPFILAAFAFLKRLNLSQIGLIVAVGFALFYRVEYRISERHSGKLGQRVTELRAQLDAISTKQNVQKQTTDRTIAKADEGNKTAERIAKRIEAAPLPGGCATPPAIMGADL